MCRYSAEARLRLFLFSSWTSFRRGVVSRVYTGLHLECWEDLGVHMFLRVLARWWGGEYLLGCVLSFWHAFVFLDAIPPPKPRVTD